MAGNRRTGKGSVLLAKTCAWTVEPIRLHAHGTARHHDWTAEISTFAVSLCAAIFELGNGIDLLLGEFRKPERRLTKCALGTRRYAGAASNGPNVYCGKQHVRRARVHRPL